MDQIQGRKEDIWSLGDVYNKAAGALKWSGVCEIMETKLIDVAPLIKNCKVRFSSTVDSTQKNGEKGSCDFIKRASTQQ